METAETPAETPETLGGDRPAPSAGDSISWGDSVREFETEAAAWLTPADRPQLTVLYAIANELDTGKFQAALISQFSLVHRALLARRPGAKGAAPQSETDAILGMFENNPAVWRG